MVALVSLLQYFSVFAVLEGFKWTVQKTYDQFVALHKVVSACVTVYLNVPYRKILDHHSLCSLCMYTCNALHEVNLCIC